MKHWIFTAVLLVSSLFCHGDFLEMKHAGPFSQRAEAAVRDYYQDGNGTGVHSLLKRWDGNQWVDCSFDYIKNVYAAENTKKEDRPSAYVLSHGLNADYDDIGASDGSPKFLTDSAKAIYEAKKNKKEDVLILSVNWDYFSGNGKWNYFSLDNLLGMLGITDRRPDKNFMASTWINAVSTLLAEGLAPLNIQSFVGHSYGAHLLASTACKMDENQTLGSNPISFVGLDPAEETLTFTGTEDGKITTLWDDNKKSKDWKLPSNITSEVYKSSAFLGTEERLGDFNYLLASEGSIVPKALGGDLTPKGIAGNHSLSGQWFAQMIAKYSVSNGNKLGAYGDDRIGGWFNAETEASRKERVPDSKNNSESSAHKNKGWDGVVNSTTSLDNINAQNPTPKLEYATGKQFITKWQDVYVAEAKSLLHQDLEGNQKSDKSNWKGTVLNPSKYFWFSVFHGDTKKGSTAVDESGNVVIKGDNDIVYYRNSKEDKYYSYSLKDGTIKELEGSPDEVMERIEKEMNKDSSGNGASSSSLMALGEDQPGGGQPDINKAITDVGMGKNQSTSILDKAAESLDKLKAKYVTLENVKKVARKGLEELFKKYPALKGLVDKLTEYLELGKEIYTLLKGWLAGGDFLKLLSQCTQIKNQILNGLGQLLGSIKNAVQNMTTKFVSNIANSLSDLASKIKISIKPEQIENLINSAVEKALDKGTEWVNARVDSYLSSSDSMGSSGESSSSGSADRTAESVYGGKKSIDAGSVKGEMKR